MSRGILRCVEDSLQELLQKKERIWCHHQSHQQDGKSKYWDENMDDDLDLDLDAYKLPMQSPFPSAIGRSRSPALVTSGGAEGRAAQNKNEKNGE